MARSPQPMNRTTPLTDAMPSEAKILVIEDEDDIAELVALHLGDLGYTVDTVGDGDEGLNRALSDDYALVVLDIMLPGRDGFEVCRRIRAEKRSLPILMLTAKSEELDKVLGLELGADDYLTKPFSIREMLARVKAIFRRIELDQEEASSDTPRTITFDGLTIEPEKRKVKCAGEVVDLTSKEFDLLLLFARNPGRVYSRKELLDEVWGYQHTGYSHTVNTHINRLRGKIEDDPSEPRYVKTVWGVGYRFVEREELAPSE